MRHGAAKTVPCLKFGPYIFGVKKKTPTRTAEIIAYQPALRPALPCVFGPVEFREYRDQLVQIDALLLAGGIEADFLRAARAAHAAELQGATAKTLQHFARSSALALRCTVARAITGLSLREFTVRCADSSLLQWFLGLGEVDRVKAPGKSTVERFSKWVGAETMAQIHRRLVAQAVSPAGVGTPQPLGLTEPVDATEVFLDSTCLKANIHFPVDWVLLRDGVRTLMKATKLIRREGLKRRMPQEPLGLSLIHILLKRGKAGADVEFGNKLWLGETRAGLIVDFALLPEAKADTALVLPAVDRLVKGQQIKVACVWGDRGLFSQANTTGLAKRGLQSGLCPRDPAELQQRLAADDGFRAGLRRRGGLEARIAILKQVFIGSPCLAKGFAHRALAVSWAVLAHNLWVLGRLKLRQDRQNAPPVAKAA